jgi:hypothetical protein
MVKMQVISKTHPMGIGTFNGLIIVMNEIETYLWRREVKLWEYRTVLADHLSDPSIELGKIVMLAVLSVFIATVVFIRECTFGWSNKVGSLHATTRGSEQTSLQSLQGQPLHPSSDIRRTPCLMVGLLLIGYCGGRIWGTMTRIGRRGCILESVRGRVLGYW